MCNEMRIQYHHIHINDLNTFELTAHLTPIMQVRLAV